MRPTFVIAIFLLAFGLFFNMLTPSGLGVFDVDPLPSSSGIDMEMATQLTEAGAAAETNPIGGANPMNNIIDVLLGGIMNVIFIVPILSKLGIPLAISGSLNVILVFLYTIDMALFIRGLSQ